MSHQTRGETSFSKTPDGVFSAFDSYFSTLSQAPGAVPFFRQQRASSSHIRVSQPAGHKQPVGVLHEATISRLAKTEDPLDNKERMLHLSPDSRLGLVSGPLRIAQWPIAATFLMGKVRGIGRVFTNHTALSAICRVTPNSGLVAVKQVRQHLAVMHIGRGGGNRVYQPGPAVHSDMGLHAEVPLIALFSLMHLRVTSLLTVLGRSGGVDNGGVHDGALAYFYPVLSQILPNKHKEPFAEIAGFQKVTELADSRLIRHRLFAKVDSHPLTAPFPSNNEFNTGDGFMTSVDASTMDAKHPFN